MELINKYIYEVVSRLPENIRDDVEKELLSQILDMLPANYSDREVNEVLSELGDPRKLAQKYRDTPDYLIGPDYYYRYIDILREGSKIFIPIIIGLMFLTSSLSNISNYNDENLIYLITSIFAETLSNSISLIISVVVIITVLFIIIERKYIKSSDIGIKDWSINDLKNIKVREKRIIPLSTAIGEIIGPVFMLIAYIIFFGSYNRLIFSSQNFNTVYYDILSPGIYERFLPAFIVVTVISVISGVLMLIKKRWTISVSIIKIINIIFSTIVTIKFILTPNFLNPELFVLFKEHTDVSIKGFSSNIWLLVAFIIAVIGAFEVGAVIYRKVKDGKQSDKLNLQK